LDADKRHFLKKQANGAALAVDRFGDALRIQQVILFRQPVVPRFVLHSSGKGFHTRVSFDEVYFSFRCPGWRFSDAGIFVGFSRAPHDGSSQQASGPCWLSITASR
jgi:hypothetical protein